MREKSEMSIDEESTHPSVDRVVQDLGDRRIRRGFWNSDALKAALQRYRERLINGELLPSYWEYLDKIIDAYLRADVNEPWKVV
jgi:hypothetical protein